MPQAIPQQAPAAPARPEPTVVGIGASAGGLAALKTFFAHVPEDSGLAFVVVVHLDPDHESHLAELLQPLVTIPVQQVTETIPLEANRVYVIPPNANLNAIDTHLRLSELEEKRWERAPIDHFFRTLAKTHDGHAIGVILSGSGSDGTLGMKDVKEKGGLTIVQEPNEAEYDGMPQSAIATGLVDLVLPLTEIPQALLRYIRTQPKVTVPAEGHKLEGEARLVFHKIFTQIRSRTGRDFSRYKRSTIIRRITRRMQLAQLETLPDYLDHLRTQPEEVRALAGPLRLLLVDDRPVVREELAIMLSRETDIEVVGQAGDGLEALEQVGQLQSDVVIMDIEMPRMNGIEATRHIKENYPHIAIIGLSLYDDPVHSKKMIEAGAAAHLSKGSGLKSLLETIRGVF